MTAAGVIARIYDAFRSPRSQIGVGPMIVMYHGIGGSDGVSPSDLRNQLELLHSCRRIVPLRDALSYLGRPEAGEIAAVTFDDAYYDFAELALPELSKREIHATLFVPAGRIGQQNDWDHGRAERRAILGATGLRELDRNYVEIGAHGYSHCRLAGLGEEALVRETEYARKILEDCIGRAVALFSYPYGQLDDIDGSAERAVRESGFIAACSTHFGRANTEDDRFRLHRIGIEPRDARKAVEAKFKGAYDWVSLKEKVGVRVRGLVRRGR